jgi:hypothetical protein
MGARNQVGIGLSYRPTSLCSLATQFQTQFPESIPHPLAGFKIPTLEVFKESMGARNRGGIGLLYRPTRDKNLRPTMGSRNQFQGLILELCSQATWAGGPVRQPYAYLVPSPLSGTKVTDTGYIVWRN